VIKRSNLDVEEEPGPGAYEHLKAVKALDQKTI